MNEEVHTMQKRGWVRIVAVVGLVCVLGAGWALGSSRVQDVLQPSLEIPLYEGAQVEWEVHLTAQEMAKGLSEWVEDLSVLKVSGYTIEGERALDVLNFCDQTLNGWRRILWIQPSESGGVRLFVRERNYLLLTVSKRYEATDLVIATAQTDESALNVPIFESAELQWELVLTQQDLLGHLKRWFGDLATNPPLAMRMRLGEQPERPQDRLSEPMGWLSVLGIEMLSRLFQDFSELRVVGSRLKGDKALDALSFYEQQFSKWRRNLWIKPDESGSIRVFTRSDAQGLQELSAVATMSFGFDEMRSTTVIVLRARR